jgi:hypothetical protein
VRFLYLRDPLFLFCVATYFVNRFVLKAVWDRGFVHEYLNDLICIPFWVPIMLSAQRLVGLRDNDASPRPGELVLPLIIWSWVFEIILPRMERFGDRFVADHLDVLCYALGALLAGLFWQWWYDDGRPKLPEEPRGGTPASAGEFERVGGVAEARLGETLTGGVVKEEAILLADPDGMGAQQTRPLHLEVEAARPAGALQHTLKERCRLRFEPVVLAENCSDMRAQGIQRGQRNDCVHGSSGDFRPGRNPRDRADLSLLSAGRPRR